MNNERPTWDEYFFSMCELVATRSTCTKRDVGAVIVSEDNEVLTTGYNGAPKGATHCTTETCLRQNVPSGTMAELCAAAHGEQNAIAQAAKRGIPINGATMYCTHKPCLICAKMIINAGIKLVLFKHDYPDPRTDALINDPKIKTKFRQVK